MVSLAYLKKLKITPEDLKPKLSPLPPMAGPTGDVKELPKYPDEKIARLRNRIRTRIINGREENFANFRLYHALDLAWDTPFKQVTPTLLQKLLDGEPDEKKVMEALASWGISDSEMFTTYEDPKSAGKMVKKLNMPWLREVFVPVVRAYVTIRQAKIMNDRRQDPLFKYDPALNNAKSRMQCDVITSRVQAMSRQYGYWNVIKQAVFQMLHYGVCLQFPVEEWHREEQWLPGEGEAKATKTVVKEGLRYHMPHPAKMFFDPAHRPSTFNTDSGCSFAGYWRVKRYRELRETPGLWNTDKISIGATEWWTSGSLYWNTVYGAGVIKNPADITAGLVAKTPQSQDRETKMAVNFYTTDYDDAAVTVTEYFEKLIPKDNGLGDYDCPVWFRFVIGGDDTFLYATPLAYNPVLCYLYDSDELRDRNASMTLEVLPFQDHLSNLLTQFILSAKANLANVTFVDTDVVETDWIQTIRNLGKRLFVDRNFIPFSGKKALRSQQGIPTAFFSHSFPMIDTNAIATAMRLVLDMLERIMVMSSQEVAQAASHELREKEVVNIQNSTSTRLAFTTAPVDDAGEAMKQQLYEALMEHGEEEFYANIPLDAAVTPKMLEDLGFTWDKEEHPKNAGDKKVTVSTNKKAIAYVSFTTSKDFEQRPNNPDVVTQLGNALNSWLANPILGPAIGAEQAVQMANIIAKMAGFPKEFQMHNMSNVNELQQELAKFAKELDQKIMSEVQDGLKPMMDLDMKQQAQLDQILQMLHMPPVPPPATINGGGTPPELPNATPVNGTGTGAPSPAMALPA
jgi:hypothetical protein